MSLHQRRSRPLKDVHVQLEGAVDLAAAPALRTRLQAADPAPDEVRLVVDLSRVTLLDAAAMGVLAQASRTYGEVVLRGTSSVLRRVLAAGELTRVVRVD